MGALGSEEEVFGPVDAEGIDDGALEGCCDDRLGRVSGMEAPVYFAE
jgi:hypothetical protein